MFCIKKLKKFLNSNQQSILFLDFCGGHIFLKFLNFLLTESACLFRGKLNLYNMISLLPHSHRHSPE